MAPFRVGLIGYGFAVKSFHLPFILPNPDYEVYAFLQRAAAPEDKSNVPPGKHCTVDYPNAKHYRTGDEFFADKNIDLVIVCTGHDSHADYAEAALLAGKHVVVEKVFTCSTEESNRVLAAARKSGKLLTVYQNRRYDSDYRTLEHLVKKSAFGTITECEFHYDVSFPDWMLGWKDPGFAPGAGMMFGLGSHTIDQALELFGHPETVTGLHRSLRGIDSETDDSFTILLQYGGSQKNLVVTVKTSVVALMVHPLKYFIRGYDGTFMKFGEDVQESQISRGMTIKDPGFGEEPEETYGELTTKVQQHKNQVRRGDIWVGKFPSLKGSYEDYYIDLAAALKGEKGLVVKPEQSADGVRIIELARESAQKRTSLPFK